MRRKVKGGICTGWHPYYFPECPNGWQCIKLHKQPETSYVLYGAPDDGAGWVTLLEVGPLRRGEFLCHS